MKTFAVLLAILLLLAVSPKLAQRYPGGGGVGRRGRGSFCGRQRCQFPRRCIETTVRCIRSLCLERFRCI
ncbi:hypothetical protein V5799_031499 [Amblyomma americanum]|uniref:Secreted protein n=1 Tax=Amblyomma americanum TaxID=6943 RepID=A0AAQ4EK96_AMBAM